MPPQPAGRSSLALASPTPAPPLSPTPYPATCPSILRVGGDVTEPIEISRVQPQYPETKGHRFSSTLFILEAVIDRNGIVQNPRFLRSPEITPPLPTFGAAILDSISAWRYRPATYKDRPVCVYLTVTVSLSFR